MIQVEIRHENDNRSEYGYGLYVNGFITDNRWDPPFHCGLFASECVELDASEEEIKKAERRVRQNARNAYKRMFGNT